MSKQITPGSWGGAEEIADVPISRDLPEFKLTSYAGVITSYKIAMRAIGVSPTVIYYPCCGTDTSPSKAFPSARVIYVDQYEPSIDACKRGGYDAHLADVKTFNTGVQVDLCILLNPQVPSALLVSSLASNGHVLCNNYHGTADQLRNNPEFELLGFVQSDLTTSTSQFRSAIIDTDVLNLEQRKNVPHLGDDIYLFRKK